MSAPQSDISQFSFLWTRGVAARETLHFLDRNGFDAEPLLSEAELSRSQLTQDLGGVSVASQHRFLELAASETNDKFMDLPIISGDSHLLQILEAHADILLLERASTSGLRGLVENHLLSVLSSGKVDAAAVANPDHSP